MSDEESLSVVMPVYNALPHLDGAIRSILDQTHRNYEFVIYDDASTDGSTERLRQWARDDFRIRLFEGKRNLGPVGSSAFIVEHSTGPLVARMDADDLCAPDRLERQLEVLRNYPCAGLVGTLFDVINDRGQKICGPDLWRLTRKAPFVPFAAHGSICSGEASSTRSLATAPNANIGKTRTLSRGWPRSRQSWSFRPHSTRCASGRRARALRPTGSA